MISDMLLLYPAAISAGLSVMLIVIAIWILNETVPESDRSFMDPLPLWLKIFWPMIRIIEFYITSNFPVKYLDYVEKRIQKTGIAYILTAEEFFALRILSAILQPVLAILVMLMLHKMQPLLILFAVAFGFFFPEIWLQDMRKRRENEIVKALPVYLDFISMSVEAGLNFTGALTQSMEKGPKGPLRNEFAIVMRDLRAGLSRTDALQRMADRIGVRDVTTFVRAVIQAEKLGSSMKKVLQVQAEQRRSERFQRAEKKAMEAPIKLVGPLIIFIFPVTFIILGFPIIMKFLNEGFL